MSTSALAPAAQDEIATLFVGFELTRLSQLDPDLGNFADGLNGN